MTTKNLPSVPRYQWKKVGDCYELFYLGEVTENKIVRSSEGGGYSVLFGSCYVSGMPSLYLLKKFIIELHEAGEIIFPVEKYLDKYRKMIQGKKSAIV